MLARLRGIGLRRLLSTAALVLLLVAAGGHLASRISDYLPPGPGAEASARRFCSQCHVFPSPDVLPRGLWPAQVRKMLELAGGGVGAAAPAGGGAIGRAEAREIIRFYVANAPGELPPIEAWPPPTPTARPRFVRRPYRVAGLPPLPATANVRLVDLDGDERLELVACDMRHGLVLRARPYEPGSELETIARLRNPCHAEVVDLDRDGRRDLLVADLGDFAVRDHELASVVWLRGREDGSFEERALAEELPRAADAQAADFDGDGDLDVVVAMFGWRRLGGILLLENRTRRPEEPFFIERDIDPRVGPIHAPPVDLDGDGRVDFVALLAQHHEAVDAFLNEGPGGGFRRVPLYRAPHPNWGSSGIQLVDLDRDGDVDVLLAHGDTLDDAVPKPYHGIQWIENRGLARGPAGEVDARFEARDLALMPGVHRAQAADLDGDGDLDIAACAFIPCIARGGSPQRPPLASVVWLEQVAPGRFERRALEMDAVDHATLDLGDYDLDGDVDMVVGNFTMGCDSGDTIEAWLEVWENATRP